MSVIEGNTAVIKLVSELMTPAEPQTYSLTGMHRVRPAQLMPLALRRVGAAVEPLIGKQRAVIRAQQVVGGFRHELTSLLSSQAHEASLSTALSNSYFRSAGVSVPEGRSFAPEQIQEARTFFSKANEDPWVVKPCSARRGVGTSLNVRSLQEFDEAWDTALVASSPHKGVPASNRLIVERHISGINIRACVLGEELIAATARIPLFCVGDGRKTFEELVDIELARRATNPHLSQVKLDMEEIWDRAPVSRYETPEEKSIHILSTQVGLQSGSSTLDVTDHICPGLASMAIEAAWAVPGARIASIDLVTPSLDSIDGATVVKFTGEPRLALHHFPWIGEPRPVADRIARTLVRHGQK